MHDLTVAANLVHGKEQAVYADAGYQGAHRREDVVAANPTANWHITMRGVRRRALEAKNSRWAALTL